MLSALQPLSPGFVPRLAFLLALLSLIAGGCASSKASRAAPELPPRHWLEEAPGVPVENKDKLAAAVPNLYDPNKVFNFEDCVYLSIQQSPMLAGSAVELEIKKLSLTDAIWQYIPEPRMTITSSSNITQFNQGARDAPLDYGRNKLGVNFHAAFPNPVGTYFNHQAQKVMVGLAIASHRKAIGAAIEQIAEIYLRLEAQRRSLELQKTLLPLHKELVNYWKQVEAVEGRQGVSLSVARQRGREVELRLEREAVQEVMLRTRLKILAGVDPQQRLKLDTNDAPGIIGSFDGGVLNWESRWPATEDELLVRSQVKLHDYNIMVAWARYLPDVTLQVNRNPPAGQYQPPSGVEDTFVHLTFDFPLLDWGRRYRGVQTARMGKAMAFQEQARKRTDYANKWLEAQQRVNLAETSLKIAQNSLDVAEMESKEAEINFREGLAPFPALAARKEALTQARAALINAALELNLARLKWMTLANVLQERFLGLPAKEVAQ